MSLFWTDPTALFWTNPSALFWSTASDLTLSEIGSATGSFSTSSGTYTVSGTGSGVTGISDSLVFVNQSASGNIEIISNVTAQSGANAYACAGLMIRDSQTAVDGQCAFISISPQNGINFSYRTADGDTATTTLGPSLATPVWLRLVVSQTSVAGYQSPDGINWEQVGVCTMTLPTSYFSGVAVSSNLISANVSTFENLSFLTDVPQRSANMLCWLRADVGVTYESSSNQVSLWQDQSSVGYNGSQSTNANQPILIQNAVNNFPAINFSSASSGQFLQLPAGLDDFTAGASIFLVVKPTAFAANSTMFDLGNGALGDNLSLNEVSTSGGLQFNANNGTTPSTVSSPSGLTLNSFQLIEIIYGASAATMYINGNSIATSTTMQTLNDVTRSDNFLGQSGSGGNFFQGEIAEFILYNAALTTAQQQFIESYAINKYGL